MPVLDEISENPHTPTVWTTIVPQRIDFVNAFFSFLWKNRRILSALSGKLWENFTAPAYFAVSGRHFPGYNIRIAALALFQVAWQTPLPQSGRFLGKIFRHRKFPSDADF